MKSSITTFLYRHSWHYRYWADKRADAREFRATYTEEPCHAEQRDCCIAMFSGHGRLWGFDYHGGLADRLKGMISIYKVCKEMGTEFKILHTLPFCLDTFLVPADIDWLTSEAEVSFNLRTVSPHWLRHSPSTPDEKAYFHWRLKKLLKAGGTQHIYSNALFVDEQEFGKLFAELFTPSPTLRAAIGHNRVAMGSTPYVSLSYRFTHLLGDPIDIYMKELSERDKADLLMRAIGSIEHIHRQYPEHKLLVNSDSATFLDTVRNRQFNYIYTIPGVPVHIDQQLHAQTEDYMKTFVDFFLIAGAERVLSIRLGEMRNSGFPRCAALAGGRPFEVITSV